MFAVAFNVVALTFIAESAGLPSFLQTDVAFMALWLRATPSRMRETAGAYLLGLVFGKSHEVPPDPFSRRYCTAPSSGHAEDKCVGADRAFKGGNDRFDSRARSQS